ncbi:MAG TPA: SCO family protein [Burkholderiales bacterium]|nr:SCO family protein [Burkholderiales bacterium]
MAGVLGALLLVACEAGGPKFKSTDITGVDYGKQLSLTDPNGTPRSLQDFRGKVVVLFFGYTHCPDVCPTTLAEMAQVMKKLGAEADRVQVLFVTVDPERDTPVVLSRYVPAFDPRFLGLYGDADATRRAAKEFKVFYEAKKGEAPGEYTVDHSAGSYVLDTTGRLRLFVGYGRVGADDLAADIRTLLHEAG